MVGSALLVMLLTFLVPTMSASAQTLTPKRAAEIPPACQGIEAEIQAIQSDIAVLSDELSGENAAERAQTAREIGADTRQENQDEAALQVCIAAHPLLPLVNATLTGTVFYSATVLGGRSGNAPISVGITFDPNTDTVVFPSSQTSISISPLTIDAVANASGTYNPKTGVINGAGASFVIHVPFPLSDSTSNVSFTTGTITSPNGTFTNTGFSFQFNNSTIALVTAGQAQGGTFGGNEFEISIVGTLSQWPQS
jgi:hypothetical protein